jgi:hypothetical protein
MLLNKIQSIEILGDTYFLRKTFDIVDYHNSIYGFDIFNDDKCFIMHYDIEDIDDVVTEIKWDNYRAIK